MKSFFISILTWDIFISLSSVSGHPPGLSSWSGDIVGGEECAKGEFPWMVDVRIFGYHTCGASVVNNEWALTAAHCLQSEPDLYTLIAGDHNISYAEGNEQVRSVVDYVIHPNYNPGMYENDIALVKVSPPFKFNKYVQPVAIPSSNFLPTAIQTAIGWGRLGEYGESSEVLMKVDIPYVPDVDCRESYGASRIKDTMICAGTGGKDACQGDSGGPLLCNYGSNYFLCGITAFGNGCARPRYPGVFTEVSYYSKWINSVVKL